MEKQARWSLNRSLESSRNDGGSWRVLTKVLKWRNRGEQSLPGFRIGGLAEEWCPEHLEGSKSSEKKKKEQTSLFPRYLGSGHGPPETMETIMTEVPGGEGRQRRVGALEQMSYGWGRGGLYL
ncbi:hypothetical protein mRhiFer1_008840 [Rhinolophus ferrumequinum]|uniref:Uncharacterized protein n=1 Tax=Rhinolophus ferrumequinum TaxID=59479 RepID=A0A7J8AEF0_RHIFE|nr:hypothetical protein mRhiFer1_008840 [Rhinolophus ferrumequinum]